MSYQRTSHHRPRTSPITIPNKDLHRTIRHQVVIANRKRSRHTRRPNNCIRFVRAANTKATGLTGGYGCQRTMTLCQGPYITGGPRQQRTSTLPSNALHTALRCTDHCQTRPFTLLLRTRSFLEFTAIYVRYFIKHCHLNLNLATVLCLQYGVAATRGPSAHHSVKANLQLSGTNPKEIAEDSRTAQLRTTLRI